MAMRKPVILSFLVLALAPLCMAQGSDDFNKVEIFGGYSLARTRTTVDSASFTSSSGTETFTSLCSSATAGMIGTNFQRFFCDRRNFNGFDASVSYNLSLTSA